MKTLIELPSMGEMIRAELKKKDMPIKKFADEIGCGRQNIYYLLKKRLLMSSCWLSSQGC